MAEWRGPSWVQGTGLIMCFPEECRGAGGRGGGVLV